MIIHVARKSFAVAKSLFIDKVASFNDFGVYNGLFTCMEVGGKRKGKSGFAFIFLLGREKRG